MLSARKQTIFNLILIAMLLPAPVVCAETVEYVGLIEPNVVVEIGAPAEGIVDRVNVDRSDSIEAGQILVQMESSVERAAVEKAKAMVTFDGEIDLIRPSWPLPNGPMTASGDWRRLPTMTRTRPRPRLSGSGIV